MNCQPEKGWLASKIQEVNSLPEAESLEAYGFIRCQLRAISVEANENH
jgi:hypothetical protein